MRRSHIFRDCRSVGRHRASQKPEDRVPSENPPCWDLQGGAGPAGGASLLALNLPTQLSPPDSTTTLSVGQSKFTLSKQLQIQSYIKSSQIDIIHLQECKINDESICNYHYIRSNFTIFFNNTSNAMVQQCGAILR